ncbi:DUF262 domain-containing protein [Coprococcus comes]|uniref:DUF262 domain-containing protein n=1 Tax=Coprococcus comes TaxID=410072 RepID=UPI0018984BC1|nr:DUF262 domain-containing protein [Coprococcus comes]
MSSLQEQIDTMSKSIKTDSYPMSIGELAALYKDGDLDISPVYQRMFRWDMEQQSALIESILLQIPIPPIYVYQSEDGKWNLIDGQQRLSTIFKFMGILKKDMHDVDDEETNEDLYERKPLTRTKFLPALEGKYWEDDDPEKSLTDAQRRYIKRSKILIIIIDKSSDSFAQYEMFQRLNTGGSHLSPQEIRNCLLVVKNEDVYRWFKTLSENEAFRNAVPISEKDADEQGYIELVVKYFVLRYSEFEVSDSENYNNFITDEILSLIDDKKIEREKDEDIFKRTFKLIFDTMGENAFKRYNPEKDTHCGPVLVGAYEAIVPGVSENIEYYEKNHEMLKKCIDDIYTSKEYNDATKRGVRPVARIKKLAIASRKLLNGSEN